jgi:hypothetical protein
MSKTPFIIVETPRGSTTPRSVWTAYGEADYIARVIQDARYPDVEITTAAQAADFTGDRYAVSVEFLTEEKFNEYDPECLDKRILRQAEIQGWYEEPAQEEQE